MVDSSNRDARVCRCEGCDRPAHSRGLCSAHYLAWRRNGDDFNQGAPRKSPVTAPEPNRTGIVCAVPGCDGLAAWHDVCYAHMYRFKRHRLDLDRYIMLLVSQAFECGICSASLLDAVVCVDHDHSCCPGKQSCGGCIRGLLCNNCNLGIGRLGDSPELLRKAIDYLTRSAD